MGAFRRQGLAFAAVALLILGLVACGEESSSDSASTREPTEQRSQPPGGEGQPATTERDRGTAPSKRQTDTDNEPRSTPPHDDSGGGTEQFRVPGGDNSVQEFGSEASSSEFEEAAAALHAFLDSRAASDWATACEYLATDVVTSLEQLAARSEQQGDASCPQLLRGLSGPSTEKARKEAAIADVGSIRVEGERGFVLYHGAGGVDYAISMTREDDGWKVATLAGIPIS